MLHLKIKNALVFLLIPGIVSLLYFLSFAPLRVFAPLREIKDAHVRFHAKAQRFAKAQSRAYHIHGLAQGTTYQITYYAADSLVTNMQIDSIINAIDSSLSLYKSYSLINRFNAAKRGCLTDAHLQKVVSRALDIYRRSEGLFDITVFPLVKAWGFGTKKTEDPPDSNQVKAILPSVGSDKLRLTSDSLIKTIPSVKIDVNGIAQGYTVDVLAALLEKNGIFNYYVELGGELRLRGEKADHQPFRVGIESPSLSGESESFQRIITPGSGAITTSGNYRNYYQSGGRLFSHLINPKTGYPLDNELISVTVWAPDAITADGYDNVLMGMGLQGSSSFLGNQKNIEAFFIYRKPDGSVADTATKGFARFFVK